MYQQIYPNVLHWPVGKQLRGKSIKQPQNNKCNVIKVTQYGYQTLTGNIHDWLTNRNQVSKSYHHSSLAHLNQYNKIKLVMPLHLVNKEKGHHKSNTTHGQGCRKRMQSSRKIKRQFQKWRKKQQRISDNIQKQVNKRNNENGKQYQWNKISVNIKADIKGILDEWDDSVGQQKNRNHYRLRNIYEGKYHQKSVSNLQNARDCHPHANSNNNNSTNCTNTNNKNSGNPSGYGNGDDKGAEKDRNTTNRKNMNIKLIVKNKQNISSSKSRVHLMKLSKLHTTNTNNSNASLFKPEPELNSQSDY